MAALTAAAVAAVGFLAYQASAHVPDSLAKRPQKSASATPRSPKDKANPAAVPAESGKGERVVYSVGEDRVWLVEASGKLRVTFPVTPGSVDPPPGTYAVTSRSGTVTGTDGVPIEHVVRFTSVEGITIGFSAAVDGSTPKPDPAKRTGGIRASRAHGDAMWEFATISKKVVVIP